MDVNDENLYCESELSDEMSDEAEMSDSSDFSDTVAKKKVCNVLMLLAADRGHGLCWRCSAQ